MKFCPKCGSLMMPKKDKGKSFFACKCGYADKKNGGFEIREEIKKKEDILHEVASEDEGHLPETDTVCPKCGHKKAYYWLIQTRAGDEPETKFHKCLDCKHVWRDYS